MDNVINLKRGLDLKIQGGVPAGCGVAEVEAKLFAICPDDFPGLVPKMEVREGDAVACGAPLMCDKNASDIKLVSPVDGVVERVVRGDRRKILRVEVRKNTGTTAETTIPNIKDAESAKALMMKSGLWAMMRQRPYDIIPRPEATPRDIFVTAFDSAPLAPSLEDAVAGCDKEIAAGVKALAMLTSGCVYISTRPDSKINVPQGAVHYIVNGAHPAGNAGIQAANIKPVNKGEVIWTLDIVTVARLGKLILTGKADWKTTIALTGSKISNPRLLTVEAGASISEILGSEVASCSEHSRVISGNVLNGINVGTDGFLHYPYRQVTVIPEGDDVDEFMGWASLKPGKMSISRSFPSFFMRRKKFNPDARILGGRRAMIMSGLYESVLPMDILAEYLLKAIISRDIDKMEALGIYEVAPEDFALCEYVDPSKIEVQKIVREGLDYLRKELD